jgi:DHA1 family multidrug/chloramphenicol efflux transport protein-like MFS transporter
LEIGDGFLVYLLTLTQEKRQSSLQISSIANQYYRLLTNLNFLKNILSACFSVSTLIAWMLTGPFLLIHFYRDNPIYFGLFQTLIFGGFILGTHLVKHLMDKYNRAQLTRNALGMSLLSAGLTLILIYYYPDSLSIMLGGLTLISFGTGLCFPILSRLAIESSDQPMGASMSMLSVIQFFIVNLFYNETFLSLAGMAFLFSFIAFFINFNLIKREKVS